MKYKHQTVLAVGVAMLVLAAGCRTLSPANSGDATGASTVFTDFHGEKPGRVHKITVADLPAPYATKGVDNGPQVVPRPQNAWPQAPAGFKVEQFATDLENPRLIRAAPNGDVFVAESNPGRIKIYRGVGGQGTAIAGHV